MHWRGGDHTRLSVARNRTGQHRWRTSAEVGELFLSLLIAAGSLGEELIGELLLGVVAWEDAQDEEDEGQDDPDRDQRQEEATDDVLGHGGEASLRDTPAPPPHSCEGGAG